ncbi:hypothetical protein [Shewanella spartinae]|uniref:hypothetical protein n=1 Tax=Shewanella spartinae TaxID=2864205 RepID=UPI001C65B656|nr:hypothetical protein [Shewanella spartinae]QYJ92071.1 hypothetical protein K0I31_10340 [Shewanella spartinae]
MADKDIQKSKKLPKWITEHFEDSVESIQTLIQIVHLSEKGISVLRGMPQIVGVLAKVNGDTEAISTEKQLENAKKEALLAQTEVESGFPVLHGFAVVSLWSWLEQFIKEFVALWLFHRKSALSAPSVQKLRIRFGEYMQLPKSEQAAYLVELLEKDMASSLKKGVNRFESLLDPFGLGGALSSGCTQSLFELQQVRNLLAHRSGRVDRRFKSECPWIKCRVKDQLVVNQEMLERYSSACIEYWMELLYRLGDVHGVALRPESGKAFDANT